MLQHSPAIEILLENRKMPEPLDGSSIRKEIDGAVRDYKAELKRTLDKGALHSTRDQLLSLKKKAGILLQANNTALHTRLLDDIILVALGPESDAFERLSRALADYDEFLSCLVSYFDDKKHRGRSTGSRITPLVWRLATIFEATTRSKPQTSLTGPFVRFCDAVVLEWKLEEIAARATAKKRQLGEPHNIHHSIAKAVSRYNQIKAIERALPAGQSLLMALNYDKKPIKRRYRS